MAASYTVLAHGAPSGSYTSLTTTSVTRGSGRAQLLYVAFSDNSANPIASVTDSTGLTWILVDYQAAGGDRDVEGGSDYYGDESCALYTTIGDGSTGTVTIDFNTGVYGLWSHVEIVNAGYLQNLGATAKASQDPSSDADHVPNAPLSLSWTDVNTASAMFAFGVVDAYQYAYDFSGSGWTAITDEAGDGISATIIGSFLPTAGTSTPTVSTSQDTFGTAIGVEIQFTASGGTPTAANVDGGAVAAGSTGTIVEFWLTPPGTDSWSIGVPGSPLIEISSTGTGASITGQKIVWGPAIGGGVYWHQAQITFDAGSNGVITFTDPDSGLSATKVVGTGGGGGFDPGQLPSQPPLDLFRSGYEYISLQVKKLLKGISHVFRPRLQVSR